MSSETEADAKGQVADAATTPDAAPGGSGAAGADTAGSAP